jgi:hypothetical protein
MDVRDQVRAQMRVRVCVVRACSGARRVRIACVYRLLTCIMRAGGHSRGDGAADNLDFKGWHTGVVCVRAFDRMCVSSHSHACVSPDPAQATLSARTSILAAANPIGGRYDRTKSLKANLAVGPGGGCVGSVLRIGDVLCSIDVALRSLLRRTGE